MMLLRPLDRRAAFPYLDSLTATLQRISIDLHTQSTHGRMHAHNDTYRSVTERRGAEMHPTKRKDERRGKKGAESSAAADAESTEVNGS